MITINCVECGVGIEYPNSTYNKNGQPTGWIEQYNSGLFENCISCWELKQ